MIVAPFVTTKSNGLGLGLSICRSIGVAHGGLHGRNNDDRGATFEFELPPDTETPVVDRPLDVSRSQQPGPVLRPGAP